MDRLSSLLCHQIYIYCKLPIITFVGIKYFYRMYYVIKITIMQGDPGEGKTTIALRIAALLSRGEKLPCDDTEQTPAVVIYQTAEDGLDDTVKPRLMEADADCTMIKVIDETEQALSMLDKRIEQAILKEQARVLILDPIQAYVGKDTNMNCANEIRDVMKNIGMVAAKHNCAVILVGHMNKNGGGKSTYRGLGSIDFQASARSVLIVGRLRSNPEIRVMAHSKSSLAPEGKPIAFELNRDTGFKWIGHYDITLDDLLNGFVSENKSALAERLIKECLADGQAPQSDIVKKAKSQDISKRILDEQRKILE